jgi:hypothetical protein
MVDRYAVPLALERTLDTRNDWPGYCNRFRDRDIVTARVSERSIFQALDLSPDQREQVRKGQIWVSAPGQAAHLSAVIRCLPSIRYLGDLLRQ